MADNAPAAEFRGAWVTAWNNGFLSPAEADETIRLAKRANLNALFIQVRKVGDAYYRSSREPFASNVVASANYDPLEYVIRKAHTEGLEVHAWIVVLKVWSRPDPPAQLNHVVNMHPEWLTRTANGETRESGSLYLDPGVPGVQDYTLKIVQDLIQNYDIDGIHLDYIRYPGSDFGYAADAVARFNLENRKTGVPANADPAWQRWRRKQVTDLMRKIYREAISIKPRIKVTAATVAWGSCSSDFNATLPFTKVYQDWRGWMREGIIDANMPMNYRDERDGKSSSDYRSWLRGFSRWRYGRQVYAGLDFNRSPDMVVEQIKAARDYGMDGAAGFSFNQTPDRLLLVEKLRQTLYSEPAPAPDMLWKNAIIMRMSRERYAQAIDAATIGRNPDKAIELLKEAINIDPAYANAHFRLGYYFLEKHLYELAMAQFEKTLELDPDYSRATDLLAIARRRIENK